MIDIISDNVAASKHHAQTCVKLADHEVAFVSIYNPPARLIEG